MRLERDVAAALPAPSAPPQGEERDLEQTGTKAYYESLRQERVRPRKLRTKPQVVALPAVLPGADCQLAELSE
jgi:hypothetical protein